VSMLVSRMLVSRIGHLGAFVRAATLEMVRTSNTELNGVNADRLSAACDRPIASFGLTDPQARFLVTVMRHSGVFVGRQYAAFAGITHGQTVHDFIETLRVRRFVTPDRTRYDRTDEDLSPSLQAAVRSDRRAEQPESPTRRDRPDDPAPDGPGRCARDQSVTWLGSRPLVSWAATIDRRREDRTGDYRGSLLAILPPDRTTTHFPARFSRKSM
jgi:hypothetical protein